MTALPPSVVPVPVSETDYLDEDKQIRGQNYVCLSFISPEDVMKDKDAFFFNKYIKSFSKDIDVLLASLAAKYPDDASMFDIIRENHSYVFSENELQEQFRFFKGENSTELESEFHKEQNYRPTIRGIKVRGVFDTLREAQVRAELLKKMGDKFDIFVGQVGCWCPWSPNPNDMEDQQYAETGLNTLMMKYKENMEHRDQEYEDRKTTKINKIKEDNDKRNAANISVTVIPEEEAAAAEESVPEAAEAVPETPR